MSGPIPKRSEERTRRNEPALGAARMGEMLPVKKPSADRANWHKRALSYYESAEKSGQTAYWQQSDWETLKIACDLLTNFYDAVDRGGRGSSMIMENFLKIVGDLGMTEGSRRRDLRLELEAPQVEEESAADKARNAYAQMFSAPASNVVPIKKSG